MLNRPRCTWCGGLDHPDVACPHPGANADYGEPPIRVVQQPRGQQPPRSAPVVHPRWGPLELLGFYLTWHIVQVCEGRCLVCRDAYEYLANQGALPLDVARVIADPSRKVGSC
jgi:hypothetical protein